LYLFFHGFDVVFSGLDLLFKLRFRSRRRRCCLLIKLPKTSGCTALSTETFVVTFNV